MRNAADFKLIKDYDHNIQGAVNLNYMFPVFADNVTELGYKDIYNIYANKRPKQWAEEKVADLQMRENLLKDMKLGKAAISLYRLVNANPELAVSERCLDFKEMEAACIKYNIQQELNNEKQIDITYDKETNRFKASSNEPDFEEVSFSYENLEDFDELVEFIKESYNFGDDLNYEEIGE